jgi:hypothetical protein
MSSSGDQIPISSVLVGFKLKFFSACLGESARMGMQIIRSRWEDAASRIPPQDLIINGEAARALRPRVDQYLCELVNESARVERQSNCSDAHDSVPAGGRWEEVCLG